MLNSSMLITLAHISLSPDCGAAADLPDCVLGGASQGWRGLGLHTPGYRLQLASSADDTQSHSPLWEWSVVQLNIKY